MEPIAGNISGGSLYFTANMRLILKTGGFVIKLFENTELLPIYNKVIKGERLSREDGLLLMRTENLSQLAYLANHRRKILNGERVFYVKNQHLNPTNVCEYHCLFCSFRRDDGEEGAYTYSLEEIRKKVSAMAPGIREIHIVSGLNPSLSFEYYEEIIRIIKEERPHANVKAFTAVEIMYFVNKFNMTVEEVLTRFREKGLEAMPGGGAEIFSERIQRKLFKQKATAEEWLKVHHIAHGLGIKTNATMLYGHIETDEERVDHFIRLREQQDLSGGFTSFIPLAFQHENNSLRNLPRHSAQLDMRIFAVARLMLDNFPHLKAYWVTLGIKLAQLALNFGADELEGTVVEETIMHMAGSGLRGMTESELIRVIGNAGRIPVERDALYNVVAENEPAEGMRNVH
jgi:aminodeoxyfutalosine synthase